MRISHIFVVGPAVHLKKRLRYVNDLFAKLVGVVIS